jgi:uncharacterized protein (DUF433 family)
LVHLFFPSKSRQYRLMPVEWKLHIVSDPEILRGKPRLKGTRIPVSLILGYLAAGKSADGITAEFPDLTREQIAACLDYARELAEFEVVVRWPCGFWPITASPTSLFGPCKMPAIRSCTCTKFFPLTPPMLLSSRRLKKLVQFSGH